MRTTTRLRCILTLLQPIYSRLVIPSRLIPIIFYQLFLAILHVVMGEACHNRTLLSAFLVLLVLCTHRVLM